MRYLPRRLHNSLFLLFKEKYPSLPCSTRRNIHLIEKNKRTIHISLDNFQKIACLMTFSFFFAELAFDAGYANWFTRLVYVMLLVLLSDSN
jgi:hypothetical protein